VGYLICEDCGGYYELQKDESPDDFEKTCECDGKLKYVENLDFSDDSENLEESGKIEETPIISNDVKGLETEKPINEDSSSQNITDKSKSSSEKISKTQFCPKCGTKNTQNATFCKKCGYNFITGTLSSNNLSEPKKSEISSKNGKKSLKSKFTTKKVLIPIIVVLLVLIALGGYFVYQNYKMQQMDNNMVQYQSVMANVFTKYAETNQIANSTPPNYDQIYGNIDSMIADSKEAKTYAEAAYQYADGPYKELITQQLKFIDLYITDLELWKQRVQYIQQNNLYQVTEIKKQEDTVNSEETKLFNDISTFISTHPEIKQHVNQYWNFKIE
jgi:ribosomal protein L40E